ncbi:hypothetical protein M3F57_06695 [Brachybacterium muris]|uniref:hypothetical protein n=1 Tax=Brachybacterium muris TaxID=219301 RepID=UPI00223BEA86|nr:hypothetical protein [Brachybacterium muris]MCT2295828.1 hypothetical protein [Brachybacterium muris]
MTVSARLFEFLDSRGQFRQGFFAVPGVLGWLCGALLGVKEVLQGGDTGLMREQVTAAVRPPG